jgi:hypothetical protein
MQVRIADKSSLVEYRNGKHRERGVNVRNAASAATNAVSAVMVA